jgi:hypothetical protein
MKFAIRDDDVSFFTKPMELESLYKDLWEKNIPISFAVKFLVAGNVKFFIKKKGEI